MTASPPVFLDAGRVTLHPCETEPGDDGDDADEVVGESDLDFCHRLVNDHRVRQGLTLYRPQPLAEEREFVESLDSGVRFVARADGERVGVVDLVNVDDTFGVGELGYFFDPDF
mgnify:CR=1 FL=1